MLPQYANLPFTEAIDFFRDKIDLDTDAWTDIWQGMHSRAFVIAGATRDDVLTDIRAAVDSAITEGTTIEQFRQAFDTTVQKHGWPYQGGRGWRTRVIYDTNLRQAYNAGREKQWQENPPPYFRYVHGDSQNPRELHLAWDGTVLASDDPWWQTHTPMNGWGCSCKKRAVYQRQLKRLGKTGPDPTPDDGTYQWQSKDNSRSANIPNGIDPGFDYNIGDAAWGRQLSADALATSDKGWTDITPGNYATLNRPKIVPVDPPVAERGPRLTTTTQAESALTEILGGEEKVFNMHGQPVLVNANSLANHIDLARSEFLPFIDEAITNPYEVWATFEQHQQTGKVRLRQRVIKVIKDKRARGIVVVTDAMGGMLKAITFLPPRRASEVNKRRRGMLIYSREEGGDEG